MKTIFAVLAICMVAVQALPQPAMNYEILVEDIINEAQQMAVNTAVALEHQYREIVVDPAQQVDAAVQSIESRRDDNEACVVAEESVVQTVVDDMHHEMNVCGLVAAHTSAEIATDVTRATQQIVFDGYDVLMTYQKCKNYKNSVLKNSCYARLSIKATLYLKNARRSMKVIQHSTNERIPAVFTDADGCTHGAADVAIVELDKVQASIDACVARNH